jgi:hypothetical protein
MGDSYGFGHGALAHAAIGLLHRSGYRMLRMRLYSLVQEQ